jgi:hypothetical protein
MRRILPLFAVVLAICVAAIFLLPASDAVRLPNGGTARILTVTYGMKHRATFPAYSWTRNWQNLPKQRTLNGLAVSLFTRPHGWTGATSSTPILVVWFHISDRRSALPYAATLVTSDGQRFATQGRNGSSSDGDFCSGMQFPVVPYTERMLRLDVNFEGKPCSFKIRNPAYGMTPPPQP